jgi:predicted DCC family thiol-disulfide oxidoreductase YuxK
LRLYDRHFLLWDGDCAFCARFAGWVQRHDERRRFHVVPYQRAPSPPMTEELREACSRALHVVRADGQVLHGGAAAVFVLDRLGWRNTARFLGSPSLLPAVEWGYRRVAAQRPFLSRLFRF